MRLSMLMLFGAALPGTLADASTVEDEDLYRRLVAREGELFQRGLADTIWNDIKDGASCTGCEAILVLLKGLSWLGDKTFISTLQGICRLSGAEDDDVCNGAIKLEGPIIAKAIRDMSIPSKTSKLFCITFLGVCDYPAVTPWNIPFPNEKPASLKRPAPSGQEPLKIVHFSDIHVDPLYVEGSSANCSKPICCRPYEKDDQPGNSDSPAGAMGEHNCDVPISLEESMYAAIKELVPDASFSIFTGDIVDHAVWNTSDKYNTNVINGSYTRMAKTLGTIYGTAGNHEMNPTNAFPPASVSTAGQWMYSLLSSSWSQWIGPNAIESASAQGVYSVRHGDTNLRVISLNTNMYYLQNYWLYRKNLIRDPNDQFAWLVEELDKAEMAGERVYLIGHMAVGSDDAFHDQSNYLDQIVNRYKDTIAAMFYGHTHKDEFQISYSDYSARSPETASAMSYIGPSLTPTSGMPSFRVYHVDPVTFAVVDHETYMADMDDPDFQTQPVWTKYYSAREAYGPLVPGFLPEPARDGNSTAPAPVLQELSPAFWHRVTEAFTSNPDAFNDFLARKSRGWEPETCDGGDCLDKEICQLRAARAQDNCYEPKPGIHFKKRSENPFEERDECGISVGRATVGALALRGDAVRYLTEAVARGEPGKV